MWRVCLERNIEKYFRSVFLVWISTYVLKMSTLKKWNKRNANYFHVLFYCTKDKTVWMTLVYTSILFFHVQLISFGKVLMRKHLFVYVMDILKKFFLKRMAYVRPWKKVGETNLSLRLWTSPIYKPPCLYMYISDPKVLLSVLHLLLH